MGDMGSTDRGGAGQHVEFRQLSSLLLVIPPPLARLRARELDGPLAAPAREKNPYILNLAPKSVQNTLTS